MSSLPNHRINIELSTSKGDARIWWSYQDQKWILTYPEKLKKEGYHFENLNTKVLVKAIEEAIKICDSKG